MLTLSTIAEARAYCDKLRRSATSQASPLLGFVPTMGALHPGHISLIRAAPAKTSAVIVSIFVNPTQFGPNEDFNSYPRHLDRDSALLIAEGIDMLFTPTVEEMYPPGAATFVDVEGISSRLDGRSRPGHFRGVATVVSKLFNILAPDFAFFGQKDAAQCAVIRRMVRDLALPTGIVVCPIVREPDGLAMSSRNAYLDARQRAQATILYRTLQHIESLARSEPDSAALISAGQRFIAQEPDVRLDYLELVDPDTLEPLAALSASDPTLLAIAAYVGGTRLIDNLLLPPR